MAKKILVKLLTATCGVLSVLSILVSVPEIYSISSVNPAGTSTKEGYAFISDTDEKAANDVFVCGVNDVQRINDEEKNAEGRDTYMPITDLPDVNGDTGAITEEKGITLYISSEKRYVELSLEEYITGVVIAEMSYQSETEALKAQSVAARTFCLHRMRSRQEAHPLSGVCDRASHCMAYYSKEYIINKYGEEKGNAIWERVNGIVMSTEGEYLTYNGEIISAMFHDSSYGCTESSENLYGSSKDYLICVRTPEEKTEYTQSFSVARVIKSLFENTSELEDISNALGEVTRFEDSGRCKSIEIYGKRFTGLQVFVALGLRSMDFDVSYNGAEFVFTSRGFGHGIGMSQKGAKIYAEMGLDYREILLHYYKACRINNLRDEK